MTEMTALRAHRRGGPEQLVVERAPVPGPVADDVLVAVHAAAITGRRPGKTVIVVRD